jgi:superfamily II DNA/RNA helicase
LSFADLHLSDELLRAIADSGYTEPTPIQRQAIPHVLMGRDIIGVAQTGTGKTASFVLPMIDILASGRSRARMPRSLIIAPTRELADQAAENFVKYGKYHKLTMALLIGGVGFGDQDKALAKGVDVLIATPGRLMDQFERGKILLSGVDILVIDEADRMLDMGFIPDVEKICSKINPKRQTLLFSATMPPPIKKLADRFMREPKVIEVSRPATTNASIAQSLVEVTPRAKRDTLRKLLRGQDIHSAIVFCNRKREVKELAENLKQHGFRVGQIHGDMEQPERMATLDRFKNDEINMLVASDVAARGLDIKGVSHVFNYDTPHHAEDYVHRIGRTGRAGKTGIAITFATEADAENVAEIEKLIGQKIPRAGDKAPVAAAAPAAPVTATVVAPEPEAKPSRGRGRRREPKPAETAEAAPAPRAVEPPAAVAVAAPAEEAPRREPPRRAASPEAPRPEARERGGRDDRGPRRDQPRRDYRDRDDVDVGPGFGTGGSVPAFLLVSARI